MQMHDTLRQAQGKSFADALAAAFGIAPAQAADVMRVVTREFTWNLERNTLSRSGLADLVEALGDGHHAAYLDNANLFLDPGVRADGNAILGHVIGSKDASRSLAAQAASVAGVDDAQVRDMLPGLAALAIAALSSRSKTALADIMAKLPSLGKWGKGNPHGDLADILRRRAGAGPYSAGLLRDTVHNIIARAGNFTERGVIGWYLRFMLLRSVQRLFGPLLARLLSPK